MPFSGPKWPICHEQIFFGTNHYHYFDLPIGPFHCAKFKNKSYSGSYSYENVPFLGPKWSISPNFLVKINIILIYLSLSLCKIKKKIFQQILSYEDVQFLGPKWPFPQMRIFLENTLTNLVSFIHAYLHAKNQILIY